MVEDAGTDLAPLPPAPAPAGSDPNMADVATASQDGNMAPQRRRSGLNITDAAYGGATNDEIFPNRNRSLVVSRGPSIGKYQGQENVVGTGGLAPLALASGKLRSIQLEQQALKKQAKDLDLFAGFEKVKRAEFEPAAQARINGVVNKWTDAALETYGDGSKAAQALSDPTSAWHRGMFQEVEHVNTVTRLINQGLDDSEEVIKGMNDGTMEYVPRLLREAGEYRQKLGQWGDMDYEELAKHSVSFTGNVGMLKRMKNDGIAEMLDKARVHDEQAMAPYRDEYGRVVDDKVTTENSDALITEMAPYYAKIYGRDPNEVAEMMQEMAESRREIERKATWKPQPSSSSSSEGTKPGTISMSMESAGTRDQFGEGLSTGDEGQRLRVTEAVGGRQQAMAPRPFTTTKKNGEEVQDYAIMTHIRRAPSGEFFIQGKKTGAPRTQAVQDSDGNWIMEPVNDIDMNSQQFKDLPEFETPVKGNEGALDNYLKGVDWRKQFGQVPSAPANEKPKASTASTDKAPMEGAKKAPDGKWYVKKGNKWFRVDTP